MPLNYARELDATDWQLLEALQEDARLSYSELGRRVGLSQPATAERVRRLEEAGIIRGYHASVDPASLGRTIVAFLRLRATQGTIARMREGFTSLVQGMPAVLECHRLTGEDCYILKVAVASMAELEEVLNCVSPFGLTSTSLVLSSVLTQRTFRREESNYDS